MRESTLCEAQATGDTERRRTPILLLAMALFVLACYSNTLHAPFIFDDYSAIVHNPHLQSLWPLTESMAAPRDSVVDARPVVCLTLAINYAIGGLDPLGYHLANIAIHIANVWLVFAIVDGVLTLGSRRRIMLAATIAMVWGLHPIQTESVTYLTQRTESLMAMFLLLAMAALLWMHTMRRPRFWGSIAVLSCALGMGSKEGMIVAPPLLWLFGWIFLPRPARGMAQLHRRVMLCLFLTLAILPLELMHVHLMSKTGYGLKYLTPWDYLKTQAGVIVHYLRLVVWPIGLNIDYFGWPIARSVWTLWPQELLIVALLIATSVGLWRRHWLGFCGAWFFLILAPTSSIMPIFTEIAAERRMYLPLLSIVAPLAIAGCRFIPRQAGAALALAIVVALGVLTYQRNTLYRKPVAIWSDAVAKHPNNPRAREYLAMAYRDQTPPDFEQARTQMVRALQLQPNLNGGSAVLDSIIQAQREQHQENRAR